MRKNSVKNVKINAQVQRVLSDIIRTEIKDPRLSPMTSVVSVEVAPDLKTAKAWMSVLGDDEAVENTRAALENARGFIRSALAREMNMRNTPQITFIMDQSIAYGIDMIGKIEKLSAGSES